MKIGVIIPTYEDAGALEQVRRGLGENFDLVVIVDDGSRLHTVTSAPHKTVLLTHAKNLGKAEAIRTGLRYCVERGVQLIATVDADGEHDPKALLRVLDDAPAADLVILSRRRFFSRYGLFRRARNMLISWAISLAIEMKIEDTQSGCRLISKCLAEAYLKESSRSRYLAESEMIILAAQHHMTIVERDLPFLGVERPNRSSLSLVGFLEEIGFYVAVLWKAIQVTLERRFCTNQSEI